jgi:transcriptional regulator with XRE-family HTH domain
MMQGSLAEKLRVLRAREGLSLTEAAARAGVTRDTLSDLEHGKRQPYMPTLSKIAAGYSVPVEDLLEEPVLAGKAVAPQETGRREPDMEGLAKVMGDLRRTTRRYETYHEVQKRLDEYREVWEVKLAMGDLDQAAIEEAGRAIRAFWPAVVSAAEAEVAEADKWEGHNFKPEEIEAELMVAPAMARFQALGDKVNSIYREQFLNASESNVVPFPQLREAS